MSVTKLFSIIAYVKSYLRDSYGIDTRSLALFRILLALVVLADLASRLGDARVLYSDAGVLPRTSAISMLAPDRWSLFFLNGSPEFASALIVFGMIAAALMLVGWRTRAATIILWIIVVSLQARNNHLSYGADTLMRLSLFWAMFLPLGATWSFDRQHAAKPTATIVAGIATFALIAQNASMYFFTALLKNGTFWREEFSAVYYALGNRDLSTWLGEWVFLTAPKDLLSAFTVSTLWMEFTVPILLLLPVRASWLRMVAVALVLGLHLGIGTTMSVGLFPAISIASIMAVLPTGFWAFLSRYRMAYSSPLRRFGIRNVLSQDDVAPEQERQPAVTAGVHVVRFLHFQNPATGFTSRSVLNMICAVGLLLGLMWNVSTVSSLSMPDPIRRTAIATGLYQDWAMFAPNPRPATNWFIVEGELTSGEKVDLMAPVMTGEFSLRQAPVWDQTDTVLLNNERWRKYFQALRTHEDDGLKLAGYACRTWNAEDRGENRLETVTLTFASAITLPNSERAEPVFVEVGNWICH